MQVSLDVKTIFTRKANNIPVGAMASKNKWHPTIEKERSFVIIATKSTSNRLVIIGLKDYIKGVSHDGRRVIRSIIGSDVCN